MTASPDEPTAASSLPRRTTRSSAIAEAATAKRARPEAWSDAPSGTASARRAAAVPGEPAVSSGDSPEDSVYADGFAAGLAFAPGTGAAPDPAVPDARPRRRRKVLLSGGIVVCAVLIGAPLIMWAAGGDGRGASAASRTAPAADLGGGLDGNAVGASTSPSTSPSLSPSTSPSPSPSRSPSPSASSSPSRSAKSTAVAAGSGATKKTTAPSLANGVSIRGKGAGRCIDLTDASPEQSTPLQLWDCNGTAGQTWKFLSDGTIRTLGKCMDVIARSQDDGAGVQLTVCNDSVAQQFRVSAAHELINTQTGKCIDVKDAQTANGSQLQMMGCQGTSNEAWSFG